MKSRISLVVVFLFIVAVMIFLQLLSSPVSGSPVKPTQSRTAAELLQTYRSGSDAPQVFHMTIDSTSPRNALYAVDGRWHLQLEIPELLGFDEKLALQFVSIRIVEPRSSIFVNQPNRKLIRDTNGITIVFPPEITRSDLHGRDIFIGLVADTTPISSFVLGVAIAADGSGIEYIKPHRP